MLTYGEWYSQYVAGRPGEPPKKMMGDWPQLAYNQYVARNQQAEAQAQTNQLTQQTAQLAQQTATIQAGNQQQVDQLRSAFDAQIKAISESSLTAIDKLNQLRIQDQQAYQSNYDLLNKSMQDQQAAYITAQQKASNLQNAYVPPPNPTAMAPVLAASRRGIVGTNSANMLSNLQIVSGKRTQPTQAGLQII
jgi:hypothetical protein